MHLPVCPCSYLGCVGIVSCYMVQYVELKLHVHHAWCLTGSMLQG